MMLSDSAGALILLDIYIAAEEIIECQIYIFMFFTFSHLACKQNFVLINLYILILRKLLLGPCLFKNFISSPYCKIFQLKQFLSFERSKDETIS